MCTVLWKDLLIMLKRLFKPTFSQSFLYKFRIPIPLVLNRKWDTVTSVGTCRVVYGRINLLAPELFF